MNNSVEECGRRIRSERERLGLNQDDFAAYGGVKRVAQYFYERGARAPNLDYLLKVREIGVDLDYVLYGRRSLTASPRPGLTESEFVKIVEAFLDTISVKLTPPKKEIDRLLSAMYRARVH